jgi:hypothetical protein
MKMKNSNKKLKTSIHRILWQFIKVKYQNNYNNNKKYFVVYVMIHNQQHKID